MVHAPNHDFGSERQAGAYLDAVRCRFHDLLNATASNALVGIERQRRRRRRGRALPRLDIKKGISRVRKNAIPEVELDEPTRARIPKLAKAQHPQSTQSKQANERRLLRSTDWPKSETGTDRQSESLVKNRKRTEMGLNVCLPEEGA